MPPPYSPMHSRFLLVLSSVTFDHADPAREDSRKGKKHSAYVGSPMAIDKGCKDSDGASKQKTRDIFVPLRASECRRLNCDPSHPYLSNQTTQQTAAVKHHTGKSRAAALRALSFECIRTKLHTQAYAQKATEPPIMERASIARYCAPCLCKVSTIVANAMVGAAAKTPAKLFGLNKSPNTEKMLTTEPPMRKRIRISTFPPTKAFVRLTVIKEDELAITCRACLWRPLRTCGRVSSQFPQTQPSEPQLRGAIDSSFDSSLL